MIDLRFLIFIPLIIWIIIFIGLLGSDLNGRGAFDYFNKKDIKKIPKGWRRIRLGEVIPKYYYVKEPTSWRKTAYYSGDRNDGYIWNQNIFIIEKERDKTYIDKICIGFSKFSDKICYFIVKYVMRLNID